MREAYTRLCAQRVLVLEADGVSIRMAPPFSGVPTQHRIESAGVEYHANCAWDALGVVAALGRPGVVHSRCEQSGDPLRLEIGEDGPASSDWVFHCEVPAAAGRDARDLRRHRTRWRVLGPAVGFLRFTRSMST